MFRILVQNFSLTSRMLTGAREEEVNEELRLAAREKKMAERHGLHTTVLITSVGHGAMAWSQKDVFAKLQSW